MMIGVRTVLAAAMAVMAAAGSVLAQQDVEAMVARARAASGIEHLGEHKGVRLTGQSVIAGLPMSFELIFDAKGRFAERFEGPIVIANGYDGVNAWSVDIGGEERVLDLQDRARIISNAGVVAGWWLHPASRSTFREGPDADTLIWSNKQGASATVHVDPETGRFSRWTSRTALGQTGTSLSGEVRLGQMVFPAQVQSDADGAGTVTITSAEPWDGPESIFTYVPGPARDTRFDAAKPATLDVTRVRTGHLLVPVTIDGKDAGMFIFDTGAGGTVISKSVAERLGLTPFGELPMVGVGGTIKTSFVRPGSMSVGPMTIDQPLMTTLDTGFLTTAMGTEISGIIGYGLMHRCIVEFDKTNARVALHDPRTFSNPALTWEPMLITGRVPVCKASFEGHEGWFRLDTGASGRFLTMHAGTVKRLNLLEGRQVTDTTLGGVGGTVPGKAGTLAWFELGGRRSENVAVDFAIEDKGAFAEDAIMGNLGGKALAGFTLFFDYQGKRIAFVQQAEAPAQPPAR